MFVDFYLDRLIALDQIEIGQVYYAIINVTIYRCTTEKKIIIKIKVVGGLA